MAVLKRLSLKFLVLLQWIVNIFTSIFGVKEERQSIPPATNKLLNISATKLAESIRKSEISSEEVVLAYIKRIKEVNPIINAVVEDRFTEALAEAKKVDEYLNRYNAASLDLENVKPLLGVPITVKESVAVKGMSFTGCSLTRKGVKAKEDAEAVTLLKEAGAIILLVSSTPEYCAAIETYNNVIGRSRNPYDTRCGCGGSSGGEGALIGSGASVLGLGSDIAGSIRIPSAFNGIYGHKPTSGIVPLAGNLPWCDDERFCEYLVVGPMARYVEDLKLTMKVLAGNKASRLRLDDKVDLQNINLFHMVDSYDDFCLTKVDKAIKRAIEQGVAYLTKNFKCTENPTKFPEMGHSIEMSGLIFKLKNPPNIFTDSETKYSISAEFLKFITGNSIFSFQSFIFGALASVNFLMSDDEFKLQLKTLAAFKEKFISTLGPNGILLYPNFPTEPFRYNGFIKGMLGTRFALICNLLGCPSTCVPIGLNKKGLPLGIQVIGTPNQDNLTIEVAKELGKYFGGWQAPN